MQLLPFRRPSKRLPADSSPLRQNLHRLNFLRLCVAAAGILAAVVTRWGLEVEFDLKPLVAPGLGLLALAGFSAWRLRQPWPVPEMEMLWHLCADVLLMTALLYFSGGASNPFVTLYLLPVVIAATTLPARRALVLTALAVAGYSLLLFWYVPLAPLEHAHHTNSFGLHVAGMWVNFLVCAGLVLWIVARMAHALRERDALLARAREKALRDDKVLSLGLLAAGAAHELATPLSTMSILLKEMETSAARDPALNEDVATLKAQVAHCRAVIKSLAGTAGQATSATAQPLPARRYVEATIERWQLLRPAVPIVTALQRDMDVTEVMADETLAATLTSLLNNAADASPQGVSLSGRCDPAQLIIEILDQGKGIDEEVLRQAGRATITTKPEGKGLGIGLLLANATIERLGGSIVLMNRREGGSCTRVTVPLTALQARPA